MKSENMQAVRERLGKSSVGIAGIGGLGSNVAMALARSGVGRLVVADHDCVEESNLNRQAYFMDQVGMRKTEALIQNINLANPETDVTAYHRRLEAGSMAEIFSGVDVIIEALDDAGTKAAFIEEVSQAYPEKPIIAASGVAGIHGAERICVKRMGKITIVQDEKARSCDDAPVLAPKVGAFAHIQASLALEILTEGLDVD